VSSSMALFVGGGVLAFAGILIAVLTVAAASFGRSPEAAALSAIDASYTPGSVGPQADAFADRVGKPVTRRVKGIGRAVTGTAALDRLHRRLDYAGNPAYWSVERVLELKGLFLVVLLVVGGAVGLFVGGFLWLAVGGLVGALIGFYVPNVIIYDLGERRQQQIRRNLPDVLDTLTISVEAGLGFDAAVAQVTRYGTGPVAGELARMLQEMQLGLSRVEALRALARRTTVHELRTFTAVVVQATELGLPIATVLREQSKEMRIRRQQRAEELAQKVPVKILFPLIFCLLPSLFIVILGPGMINIARTLF
jgi:tight adherence protein C